MDTALLVCLLTGSLTLFSLMQVSSYQSNNDQVTTLSITPIYSSATYSTASTSAVPSTNPFVLNVVLPVASIVALVSLMIILGTVVGIVVFLKRNVRSVEVSNHDYVCKNKQYTEQSLYDYPGNANNDKIKFENQQLNSYAELI